MLAQLSLSTFLLAMGALLEANDSDFEEEKRTTTLSARNTTCDILLSWLCHKPALLHAAKHHVCTYHVPNTNLRRVAPSPFCHKTLPPPSPQHNC